MAWPRSKWTAGTSGRSEDEIEQMQKDAEAHADENKKVRELIDARNLADSTVYQIRKQLALKADEVQLFYGTLDDQKQRAFKQHIQTREAA